MRYIKYLSELGQTDLLLAGGKGANLGALIRAGMPVPSGFCVTTDGYRAFVEANHLGAEILHQSASVQENDLASMETASSHIRALFAAGQIPPDIASEICSAYAALDPQSEIAHQPLAVAVRSSATAEDLPDMSFAGQQDTYLNILGSESLLQAVARCWGSLWTARAIGYRVRNGISHEDVALAVVVQSMLPSEASGVLFTANPLTGKRSEMVIDATLGLGEALVSGQVEPDHYVVNGGRILSKMLGAKALSIRGQSGGGTITLAESAAERQALPDAQIIELAELGQRVEQLFKTPQDIEWAWAGGRMYLVQSRPITSLYPLPEGMAETPLEVLFSFGVWQGMLDPFTPLGRDSMGGLIAGMAGQPGHPVTMQTQRVFLAAGERLFVNIGSLICHPLGRRILGAFIASIDPATSTVLETLFADPRLAIQGGRMRWQTALRLARGVTPIVANVVLNLLWPAQGRARLARTIEATLKIVRSHCAVTANQAAATTLGEMATTLETISMYLPSALLPHLLGGIISGMAPLQILLRLAADVPDGPQLVMELTRGLPHNVTTEMDLALWATACAIRRDAVAAQYFARAEAATLAMEYHAGSLPAAAQTAVADFLQTYGVRGVGEIDLGRPRWSDDPTHIFQVLQSYLQIGESASSPEAVFRRGAEKVPQVREQLATALRQTRGGWLKARLARALAYRVRELAGLRETPKFTVIRLMGVLRTALLGAGKKLVAEGSLAHADDVFFLHVWELKALAENEKRDWRALVAERRQTYARELRRKRVPRLMLSDGTAFYEGMGAPKGAPDEAGTDVLTGSPVSPGVAEGIVHVIFDPRGTQLAPGEILVCPATDPAWTPLFLAAGGLVMEVGGMMTHGAVVAREYGIPAIVSVRQATSRLKTGQHVRLDGSTGQIVILKPV